MYHYEMSMKYEMYEMYHYECLYSKTVSFLIYAKMCEIYQNISSLIFIQLKLHHELLIARNLQI